MMLALTRLQHIPDAALQTIVAPYLSGVRFFIPSRDGVSKALGPLVFSPPRDSRATSVKTARGFIHRSLGLLKPHLCKLSTFSQRNEYDTTRAAAQCLQAGTLRRLHSVPALVGRALYGGVVHVIRRLITSPSYCSGRFLSPSGQSVFPLQILGSASWFASIAYRPVLAQIGWWVLFPSVAQVGRALISRFSYYVLPVKSEVAGSSPALGAIFKWGGVCQ